MGLETICRNRAVGYCTNLNCRSNHLGTFLLGDVERFNCASCRQWGKAVAEHGEITDGKGDTFKSVKVRFNYDSLNDHYREIAIVRNESLYGSHSTYTFSSPLVKTERRALKIAESILGNLTLNPAAAAEGQILRTVETIITFDRPIAIVKHQLEMWSKLWD